MTPELPPHLDLDLPVGEWLEPSPTPSPEAMHAWRLRRYHLLLERDPEMTSRPMPSGEPFVLTD